MSDSTCANCAVRSQQDQIVNIIKMALYDIQNNGDLDIAYMQLSESVALLKTVINIKREL
ncbi:hypothetical protein LCGC14_2228870 [marine sediment metagenome]|uniref:Uncharacterized protein n=1 Tax=marine sediment metagenome TaxID=412755 RepID=A0A0F9D8R8_9ZZZZ